MSLSSSLGDKLLFHRMRTVEALDSLFEFEVEALFEGDGDKPASTLGTTATVAVEQPDGSERFFHGLVSEVGPAGASAHGYACWRLVLRPTFWLATLRSDSRIFQQKNVKDVLTTVFEAFGIDLDWQLKGSYPPREYCVQYSETDFQFASRLMEQEGIGYFFRHAKGRHVMVLFDNPSAFVPCTGQSSFHVSTAEQLEGHHDSIATWQAAQRVGSGKVSLADYDWQRPATKLLSSASASGAPAAARPAKLELYDYAEHFITSGEGDRYAGVQIQEAGARLAQVQGQGTLRSLATGHRFKLEKHPQDKQNGEYVLVETRFEMSAAGRYSGDDAETTLDCRFTAMPSSVPWKPARRTPRTRCAGPQTARVVGPAGEEIFTDAHGRVKLHFFWDRLGKSDENSSCWVRVATPWAGAMRGWVSVPRIGDEVVVDFLEGDPDRPLITGSVYNGTNVPPWDLPANKTQSGLLTRSSPGGTGKTNANLLRFEDKKGAEQVWLHAEKDQLIEVEHDEEHDVGHDRTKSIGNDETTTVGRNRTESVGKDETISIADNRTEDVGKNETISIGDNRSESVGKDESITIGKNRTESVGENESVTVGKNREVSIAKEETLTVGDNRTTQIGKDDKAQVGKKWVVQAGDEISFVTGSASLVMKKDGTIQIKGKDITITGSGKIGIKASSDVVIKGSKIAEN